MGSVKAQEEQLLISSGFHEKVNLMDGNMRRLPPWMLTGASADVPATSNRTDSKRVVVKRKHEREEAPKEKRARRIVKAKERDESEEPKKVEIKTRGGEEAKPSIDVGKNPEMIQSVTGPEDEEEDLTVDDLLSFAQEYVKGGEDKRIKDGEGLSISQGGGAEDMLSLLLGPYFKNPPPL